MQECTFGICTCTFLLAFCKHCYCLPCAVLYRQEGNLTNKHPIQHGKRRKKKKKKISVIETGLGCCVLAVKSPEDLHRILSHNAAGLLCVPLPSFSLIRVFNSAAVFSRCWMLHCHFLLFN